MENENLENIIIKIVQKTVDGRDGVDVQFQVEEIDIGTLFDLGLYFTNLARGQRVRTKAPEDDPQIDASNSDKKQRVHKPKPVRD